MTNEELSFRTKQALAAALKTALERKKLSKITVSELAEACQVNRKTFYYHFQDVYALFRWMLEQEAIDVVKNFDLVVDTEEALRFVMEYVDENKHLINGAFDSMGYEEIKRFSTMTFFLYWMELSVKEKQSWVLGLIQASKNIWPPFIRRPRQAF